MQQRSHTGASALFMAAKAGRAEVAERLLAANATADAQLADGGSPLLAAAYKGHAAVVSMLLRAGAQVNGCRPDGLTGLCQASKAGHFEVAQLLLSYGADINAVGSVYGRALRRMALSGRDVDRPRAQHPRLIAESTRRKCRCPQ